MTGQRQQKKQERYQYLLTVAKSLITEKGFNNFSLRDVARNANMAPSNVYNYFQGKRELWFALVSMEFEKYLQALFETLGEIKIVNAQLLESFAQFHLDFAMNNPWEYEMMFVVRPPHADEIGPIEKNHRPVVFETLLDIMKKGVLEGTLKKADPLYLAYYFWGTLHGAVMVSSPVFSTEGMRVSKIDKKSFFKFVVNSLIEQILL